MDQGKGCTPDEVLVRDVETATGFELEIVHPMDMRDPDYMSAAEESRQEINEHLERRSRRP